MIEFGYVKDGPLFGAVGERGHRLKEVGREAGEVGQTGDG